MPGRSRQTAGRADRILDAAADLLVRLGYRKVTIEDIARRAGIGKGTVYLHWRTKPQLFEALIIRQAIGYVETLLDGVRRDPSMVLPHRLVAASFLAVSRSPVLRALIAGELPRPSTGRTDRAEETRPAEIRAEELLATERFFALMTRHGLLRDDVPNLAYTLSAVQGGFLVLDTLEPTTVGLPGQQPPDLSAKADALAHVVRHACEPAEPPDPRAIAAAAAELVATFDDLIPMYRAWIYSHDRTDFRSDRTGRINP